MLPLIAAVMPLVKRIGSGFFKNRGAARRFQQELERTLTQNNHEITKLAFDNAGKQIETNREEAKHKSIFVSGWRPAIGWICAVSLGWQYLLYPMLTFTLVAFGVDTKDLPEFSSEGLDRIVTGMLGLGALRTYEKYKGITK